MERRGHRQREHTADLALELWAEDQAGLLSEGALALGELLVEGARIEPSEELPLAVEGLDAEDLLVRFLNEVLVRALVDGFLPAGAVLTVSGTTAQGVLRGEHAPEKLVTEVKSATYHQLSLEHTAEGVRAFVVLDV